MADITADLGLDLSPALSSVDTLEQALAATATSFSSALGEATQALQNVSVEVDATPVTEGITGAVDAADVTVEPDAETGGLTDDITGAVDAADTSVTVDDVDAAAVGDEITAEAASADTAVAVDDVDASAVGAEIESAAASADTPVAVTDVDASAVTSEITGAAAAADVTVTPQVDPSGFDSLKSSLGDLGLGSVLDTTKSLTSTFDELGLGAGGLSAALAAIPPEVTAVASATAGLAAAAVGIGQNFKGMENQIIFSTGASGRELEGLQNIATDVFASTTGSADSAGVAIGKLNTLLGLTGEDLEAVGLQIVRVSGWLGEDVATNTTLAAQAMNLFGVSTADVSPLIDDLFAVTQDYGLGLTDLLSGITRAGPLFQQFGFSIEDTAVLIGQLNAVGVDTGRLMFGLNRALADAAQAGIPASQYLSDLADSIKNAGTESEATAIAVEAFGQRAGPVLGTLIRQGKINFDELGESLGNNTGLINETADAIGTISGKLDILANKLATALEPIATPIFDVLNEALLALFPVFDEFGQLVSHLGPVLEGFFSTLGEAGGFIDLMIGPMKILNALLAQIPTGALEMMGQAFGYAVNPITAFGTAIFGAGEAVDEFDTSGITLELDDTAAAFAQAADETTGSSDDLIMKFAELTDQDWTGVKDGAVMLESYAQSALDTAAASDETSASLIEQATEIAAARGEANSAIAVYQIFTDLQSAMALGLDTTADSFASLVAGSSEAQAALGSLVAWIGAGLVPSEAQLTQLAANLGLNLDDVKVFAAQAQTAITEFANTAIERLPGVEDVFGQMEDATDPQQFVDNLQALNFALFSFSLALASVKNSDLPELAGAMLQFPEQVFPLVKTAFEEGDRAVLEEMDFWLGETGVNLDDMRGEFSLFGNDVFSYFLSAGQNVNIGWLRSENLRGIVDATLRSVNAQIGAAGPTLAGVAGGAAARTSVGWGSSLTLPGRTASNLAAAAAVFSGGALTGAINAASAGGNRVGQAFGDGVWAGISSKASAIAAAAADVVRQAEAAARAEAKADSPSKLFADLGADIAAGMALGIGSQSALVADSVGLIVDAAETAAADANLTVPATITARAANAGVSTGDINVSVAVNLDIDQLPTGPAAERFADTIGDTIADGISQRIAARLPSFEARIS